MTGLVESSSPDISTLLAQARAAGVRVRLLSDGRLELRGPLSAVALGGELRAREHEVAALLRQEALDGLHRVLGWRPELPRPGSPRTQASLDLNDDVPRTPSGHPLPRRMVRERPSAAVGAANPAPGQQCPPMFVGAVPEAAADAPWHPKPMRGAETPQQFPFRGQRRGR